MLKFFKYTGCLISLVISVSCSSATGDRYSRSNLQEEENTVINSQIDTANTSITDNIKVQNIDSEFDFTKYAAVIVIDSNKTNHIIQAEETDDTWYGYEQDEVYEKDNSTIVKLRGYRVQVLVTDDLDEANKVKSEIYFITNQKHVYVSFEPPFYKVKVGDYVQITDADNLQFKLNQLGYTESKVISDEVHLYQ